MPCPECAAKDREIEQLRVQLAEASRCVLRLQVRAQHGVERARSDLSERQRDLRDASHVLSTLNGRTRFDARGRRLPLTAPDAGAASPR